MDLNEELKLAARIPNNVANLECLVRHHANVNHAAQNGVTALIMAAEIPDNVANIECLVRHHATVDHEDENGKTALMYAARVRDNVATLEYLLRRGATVDHADEHGWTALMIAARVSDNVANLECLLRRGANVDHKDEHEWTALLLAAVVPNNVANLDCLIRHHATVDHKDALWGRTALMHATRIRDNADNVAFFLNQPVHPPSEHDFLRQREYLPEYAPLVQRIRAKRQQDAMIQNALSSGLGSIKSRQPHATLRPGMSVQKFLQGVNSLKPDLRAKLAEMFHSLVRSTTVRETNTRTFLRGLQASGLTPTNRTRVKETIRSLPDQDTAKKYIRTINRRVRTILQRLPTQMTAQERQRTINQQLDLNPAGAQRQQQQQKVQLILPDFKRRRTISKQK